ncbi:cofactor-independent phosphoglycerate mutase [Desulfolithobacter sp.]
MKYILLVGDGMGDTPVPSLANTTPLEVARKPVIDALARRSRPMLVQTVPEGYPPGSDVANLSLLGYAPQRYYTGRAPLEAASMGVDIEPGAVAFRCNLVTVERTTDGRMIMLDYSAGHISSDEGRALIEAIQAECGTDRLRFYPGISYRHLLLRQGEVDGLVTVPPHDYMDQDVTEFYNRYAAVPDLHQLMERAATVLADHPVNRERARRGQVVANSIWLWGEGRSSDMEPLREKYGVSGSLISAVDLLKGLGVCSGLRVLEVEGATGYLDTNYQGKAQAALAALEEEDFVLVHVEAPDEAGHQGRVGDKIQAIEDFDRKIVAPIIRAMEERGEDFRVVITMDHYTPLARRTHEDWPVPMIMYDSRGVSNPLSRPYTEENVKQAVTERGERPVTGPEFFQAFIDSGQEGA